MIMADEKTRAIITRNIKDFKDSKIEALSPDSFLKTINASS